MSCLDAPSWQIGLPNESQGTTGRSGGGFGVARNAVAVDDRNQVVSGKDDSQSAARRNPFMVAVVVVVVVVVIR